MATIKGKWQFTNDSGRIKDLPVHYHYCEQLVNFISTGYYDGTKMFTKLIFEYGAYDMPYIKFYCEEMSEYKFLTRSDTGAINLSVISLVDFGSTPQEVSDDFLDLMNLVAVPTNDDGTVTLNGKYVVSPAGVGKIFTNYDLNSNYYDRPTWYTVSYTNTIPGAGYNCIACFNSQGLGGAELYFGDATQTYDQFVGVSYGFKHADGFQIIDFGQQNQTIDAIFYGEVLRYALVPCEEGFVDAAGLVTLINKSIEKGKAQIKAAAKAALPTMTTILEYNASSTTTTYTFSNASSYDALFLCVTPAKSATQIFLTVSTKNIGYDQAIQIDAPDNTMVTRFQIYRYTDDRMEIKAVACYNQKAAEQSSTGYIRAIYGMKIGG